MVFGLFEGKIELILPKTAFSFGETIEGRLKLVLKKEKQARKLKLVLQATEERTQYTNTGKGMHRETHSFVLYSSETILDTEKLYPVGEKEYDFKLQAPQASALPSKPQGTIGNVAGALQMLSGTQSRIKWELKASLDVSGIDVSKNMQISVA